MAEVPALNVTVREPQVTAEAKDFKGRAPMQEDRSGHPPIPHRDPFLTT